MNKHLPFIAITEPLATSEIAKLEQVGKVFYHPQAWKDKGKLRQLLTQVNVMVTRRETILDNDLMDSAISLRVLAVLGSGMDHLQFDPRRFPELRYIRCVDENAQSVAEYTVMVAMMMLRSIPDMLASTRRGEWDNFGYLGLELHGKRVAIFGAGPIGLTTARLFSNLGAIVRIVRKSNNSLPSEAMDMGIRLMKTEDALQWADIISCHLPGDLSNIHFFDYAKFQLMSPHSIFINTGRGKVVDNDSLIRALNKNKFQAAVLDVLPNEPPSEVPNHPRLTILPHIAGVTKEAVTRVNYGVIERLKVALSDQTKVAISKRYRKSKYLNTISDGLGRVIVGRAFSCENITMEPSLFELFFGNPWVTEEDIKKAGDLALVVFEQAVYWRWLVPEGDLETDLIETAMKNEMELEVGTNGLWDVTGDFFMSFLLKKGLRTDHYLLDIGCGNLRVGIKLIRYLDIGHYTGFEKRTQVLASGQQLLEREGLLYKKPSLFVTDNFLHKGTNGFLFDQILLAQVLYHLEDSELIMALDRLKLQLKPGGSIFANVQYSTKSCKKLEIGRTCHLLLDLGKHTVNWGKELD